MWIKAALGAAAVAALSCSPGVSVAQDHYEYYVRVHNHYGDRLAFSCEGGTRRLVEDDDARVVNVHGGEYITVSCDFFDHHGNPIGHKHIRLDHHNNRGTITFSHDDADHDHDNSGN